MRHSAIGKTAIVLYVMLCFVELVAANDIITGKYSKYSIKIDSINDVLALDSNWLYKKGDNPLWSALNYDDSEWDTLSTILNVKDIESDVFDGKAWFRLHMEIDSSLFGKTYALLMNQYGASEIFLDGEKIASIGDFKSDSSEERRYNSKLLPTIFQ